MAFLSVRFGEVVSIYNSLCLQCGPTLLFILLMNYCLSYWAVCYCFPYWAVCYCFPYWAVCYCFSYWVVCYCFSYWAVCYCFSYWAVCYCFSYWENCYGDLAFHHISRPSFSVLFFFSNFKFVPFYNCYFRFR